MYGVCVSSQDGYFAVVMGGIEVGSALVSHDLVTELMLTGSNKTYDAIVWGVGQEQEANKKSNTRKVCMAHQRLLCIIIIFPYIYILDYYVLGTQF